MDINSDRSEFEGPREDRIHLHRPVDEITVEIRAELKRILSSRAFAGVYRPTLLLKFLVEHALERAAEPVTERQLAVELFNRTISFDSASDPIARVEASRLRHKLQQYYLDEGRQDPLIIELPLRTYVPVFRSRSETAGTVAPTPETRRRIAPKWIGVAAGVAAITAVAGYWIWSGIARRSSPDRTGVTLARGSPPPASIVVLPFSDLSPARDQDYFCDGITEELTETLTRIEGLRVVAFTTALNWKGKAEDVREIGTRLNVALVLEGTVRKSGNRLRIGAELISTRDGYHIWSQTYDRATQDVFNIQVEIARAIVGANWRSLMGRVGTTRSAANVAAYDAYLQGLHAAHAWSRDALMDAVSKFERSIALGPTYAPAYAALAEYYALLGVHAGLAPEAAMPKAKAAALKALELDSTLSHAYASLGLVNSVYEWNWDAAEREFRRALELDPADSNQRQVFVMAYLVPLGRFDEAITQMEAAREQDPMSTRLESILGMVYYFRRDYDRAIQQFRIPIQLDRGDNASRLALGSAYEQRAQYAEAVASLQEGLGAWRSSMGPSLLGHTYALMGKREEAEKVIRQLVDRSKTEYVSPAYIASIYVGLGEHDQAMDWLEKAYQAHSASLVFLKVNPRYDPLRSDLRFQDLLRRLHLS